MLKHFKDLLIMKVFLELFIDMIYFPIWWYSKGFFVLLKNLFSFLAEREKSLAFFVWVKNIFRPMYGQHDTLGIIISIFIRVVQIIFRAIALLFWTAIMIIAICVWLVLPAIVVYEISYQLI